jgi:hypothetical protein
MACWGLRRLARESRGLSFVNQRVLPCFYCVLVYRELEFWLVKASRWSGHVIHAATLIRRAPIRKGGEAGAWGLQLGNRNCGHIYSYTPYVVLMA